MKPLLKSTLLVALTATVTFVATAAYYNQRISRQVYAGFFAQAVQIEALNDIGRLEAYDRVKEFLSRGCAKGAIGLVEVQQRLLLNGIAHGMKQGGEEVRKVVLSEAASLQIAHAKNQRRDGRSRIPSADQF